MKGPTNALTKALDASSYEWLVSNHPAIAEALEHEVREGATPAQIRRRVLSHTQRLELALRCEQAARWLAEE